MTRIYTSSERFISERHRILRNRGLYGPRVIG